VNYFCFAQLHLTVIIHASFYQSLSVLTSKRDNERFAPLNSINQSGHEPRHANIIPYYTEGGKTIAPDFLFHGKTTLKNTLKHFHMLVF